MAENFKTIASNNSTDRRILNVGPTQSKLLNNRMISAGHNTAFDQNFDSQNMPMRS